MYVFSPSHFYSYQGFVVVNIRNHIATTKTESPNEQSHTKCTYAQEHYPTGNTCTNYGNGCSDC